MAQKYALTHTATGAVLRYGCTTFTPTAEQTVEHMNRDAIPPSNVPLYYCKAVAGSPFKNFAEMTSGEKDAVLTAGLVPTEEQQSSTISEYIDANVLVTDSYTGLQGPWYIMNPLTNSRELFNAEDNPLYEEDFTPILGSGGWAVDHANRINNLETIVAKNGWLRQLTTQNSFKGPQRLLIYYGWVNSFNYGINSWNNELIAQDMAQYDLIVLGDGLQTLYDSGTHTGSGDASILTDSTKSWTTNEHVGKLIRNTTDGSSGSITANTATTITATLSDGTDNDWDTDDTYEIRHADYNNIIVVIPRIKTIKPATKIFGYVSADQDLSDFEDKVDDWEVLQVDGIFMDECGYDYGRTRAEFNTRVDYVHANTYANLCFINAWYMDHIIGTINDPSFPNTTWNASLDESNLTEDDWYLLESFPINTTAYSGTDGYESKTDWAYRGGKAIAHRYTYGINIATVGIINNDNSDGQNLFDFGFVSSLMWSLEAYGSSDTSYGASSATVKPWVIPDIGRLFIWSITATVVVDNGDSDIYWRFVGHGKLKLDFSSGTQLCAISFDSRRYPDSAVDPSSNLAKDGDHYYNTTLGMEMQYDETRGKWLSVHGEPIHAGRDGSVAAGAYFNTTDGLTMSSTRGHTAKFNGTVISMSYTRDNTDSATFEVTADGSTIAELVTSTASGYTNGLDGDFSQGDIVALRNKTGSNSMSYISVTFEVRWRV